MFVTFMLKFWKFMLMLFAFMLIPLIGMLSFEALCLSKRVYAYLRGYMLI
ncbi:hypothetical protein [Peribacillus deserti]|nr:hypothetical protein [Peribacillus deserti]